MPSSHVALNISQVGEASSTIVNTECVVVVPPHVCHVCHVVLLFYLDVFACYCYDVVLLLLRL